jgi:hypothetical protein
MQSFYLDLAMQLQPKCSPATFETSAQAPNLHKLGHGAILTLLV